MLEPLLDEEAHVAELVQHQVPARGKARTSTTSRSTGAADEKRLEHRLPKRAAAAAVSPLISRHVGMFTKPAPWLP